MFKKKHIKYLTLQIFVSRPFLIAALVCPSAVLAAAPPNDDFASAQGLFGVIGSVTGSNVDATKEPLERNHAGNAGGDFPFTLADDVLCAR